MNSTFVGLYAVGYNDFKNISLISSATETTDCVFLKLLAREGIEYSNSKELPIPALSGAKAGLYIGIVNRNEGIDIKVLPFKFSSGVLLEKYLSDTLRKQCQDSLDELFTGQDIAGPTPEYVDQDRN